MSKDLKYVLLPTIKTRRRTPKFQPWYRERLRMKYPCHMGTKNWKFVKDGLDDFRDGLPPSHDDIILEPDKGPSPVVLSDTRRRKAHVSNIRHGLKDQQIYLSRGLPTAVKRRQLVDNYITTILDHPMAFFTHFNQILPPDMYERVTKALETGISRTNAEEQNSSSDEYKEVLSLSSSMPITRPETSLTEKSVSEHSIHSHPLPPPGESDTKSSSTRPGRSTIVYDESGNPWDSAELERKEKNPYRWFIEKQREKQTAKGPTEDEEAASAMETRLRHVAEKFCTWSENFGDDSKIDIDPTVVRNLFSTAYDTKPSLSVPIKIVERTRIPAELREGVQESMVAGLEERKTTSSEPNVNSSITKSKGFFTLPTEQEGQSPRKYRYGAWYLRKNLWQRSLITEELRDPKIVKAEYDDPIRKRDEKLSARLAPLHGIDAFKDFLVEKNVRRLPKLITDVEQYRLDHPRDIPHSTVEL